MVTSVDEATGREFIIDVGQNRVLTLGYLYI